jgi:uncharacterized membrane protein SpoIIM required for sporulation
MHEILDIVELISFIIALSIGVEWHRHLIPAVELTLKRERKEGVRYFKGIGITTVR